MLVFWIQNFALIFISAFLIFISAFVFNYLFVASSRLTGGVFGTLPLKCKQFHWFITSFTEKWLYLFFQVAAVSFCTYNSRPQIINSIVYLIVTAPVVHSGCCHCKNEKSMTDVSHHIKLVFSSKKKKINFRCIFFKKEKKKQAVKKRIFKKKSTFSWMYRIPGQL